MCQTVICLVSSDVQSVHRYLFFSHLCSPELARNACSEHARVFGLTKYRNVSGICSEGRLCTYRIIASVVRTSSTFSNDFFSGTAGTNSVFINSYANTRHRSPSLGRGKGMGMRGNIYTQRIGLQISKHMYFLNVKYRN